MTTPPPARAPVTDMHVTDSIGPLSVATRFYTVLFESEKLGTEEHVRRVQIRDERGVVDYDERFDPEMREGEPEYTVAVAAYALRGEHGQGILLLYAYLPSAPLSGVSARIFGLQGSRLVPVTPKFSVYGQFGDLVKSSDPQLVFLLPGEQLEVEAWQGWFGSTIPLRVQLNNCLAECLRPQPARTDRASGLALLRVRTNGINIEADTSVVLYDAPNGKPASRVMVATSSDVTVLEVAAEIIMRNRGGTSEIATQNEWLHVRIDGREGWIHGNESFGAIGLVPSG